MCWEFTKASHETSILRYQIWGSWENLSENVNFKAKVWKLKDISHEMLVFRLQHVSSWCSGFLVPSPCLSGKLQEFSLSMASKQVVMSFCVAGVALLDILTCLQKRRKSFLVAGAILLHRLQKMSCSFPARRSTLAVSIVIVHGRCSTSDVSCCVLLRIALSGRREVVTRCKFRGRRGTSWESPFAWQVPHLVKICRVWDALSRQAQDWTHFTLSLHTLRFILPTLYTLHFTLHTLHFTLRNPHFTLPTPHSTLHTSHPTLYTLHSTLYTPHFSLYTWHSTPTLYTLNFTLSHFTLHTPHSTLYTPHFTLYTYTLHFPLHTPHSTRHTLHFTIYTPRSTLYTPNSTLDTLTLHSTLCTPHFTLHTPYLTLYTQHFTLYTLHFTLYTLHATLPYATLHYSTLCTPHFKTHTSLSTLHTLHFTPRHSALYTPHFTPYTPHSALYTLHSVLYT